MKHLNIEQSKVFSLSENPFASREIPPTFQELHRFKMQIEENKSALHHYPYSLNHGKMLLYKAIFLGISLIFAALAGYLYSIYFNWTFTLLFGTTGGVRSFLCGFSLLLSFAALVVGLWIRPEREIAHSIVNKIKQKGRKIFSKKKAELSGHMASPRIVSDHGNVLFREHYELWLEEINDIEEEVLLILQRITLSRVLSAKEKERLYNQALLELQLRLESHLTTIHGGEVSHH